MDTLFNLLLTFIDHADREVLVSGVDCLELAAIDRYKGLAEQLEVAAQHNEAGG